MDHYILCNLNVIDLHFGPRIYCVLSSSAILYRSLRSSCIIPEVQPDTGQVSWIWDFAEKQNQALFHQIIPSKHDTHFFKGTRTEPVSHLLQ